MRNTTKLGIVVVGYVGAVLIATAVVAIHVALTSGPISRASSGMFAFGDSLLFLGVFGLAAVPATGAALYFLRPCVLFWRILSVAALVVAATAIVALIAFLGGSSAAVLRLFVAPLFAIAFFLSGLFAPNHSFRILLFAATLAEVFVFVFAVLKLLLSNSAF